MDMMLDCMKDQEQAEHENEDETDQYQQDMKLSHKRKRQLTDKDIISNLMIFLIVGYDTTGMTLAFALYALSLNPDVQEKLQQEVDEAWECFWRQATRLQHDAGLALPGDGNHGDSENVQPCRFNSKDLH